MTLKYSSHIAASSQRELHALKSESAQPMASSAAQNRAIYLMFTLFYVGMIVYASLYPLSGWTMLTPPFSFLTAPIPDHISGADLLTNILAYIPLGALVVWTMRLRSRAVAIMAATLGGGLLSLSMESIQMFLPSRTSSNVDLAANILGTALGAALGFVFRPHSELMARVTALRNQWFSPDRGADVALGAVLLWALSQLSPFVPSLDLSTIRQGFSPLWQAVTDPSSLSWLKVIAYTLNIFGIGLLATTVTRRPKKIGPLFLLFVGLVLCVKPFIMGRQISLEAICALGATGVLLMVAPKGRALQALLSMLSIFAGFVTEELTPIGSATHAFNWIPFAGQIDNTVAGFGSILESLWPFVALSALTILGFGVKRKPMLWVGSTLLILVFALEWMQQSVPGRYGDITVLILAAMGWTAPWLFVSARGETVSHRARRIPRRTVDVR
jgi:VanZ family protein